MRALRLAVAILVALPAIAEQDCKSLTPVEQWFSDCIPAPVFTETATATSDEPLVLYFPGTKKTPAFALPMRSNAATIPANLPFVPVRVRNGELQFGELQAGATAASRVHLDGIKASRDAVVYLEADGRVPDALPQPKMEAAGRIIASNPLRDRDLVIVKNTPETTTLRLSGATWEAAERTVRAGTSTPIAGVGSLRLAPAAELRVSATTPVAEWLRGLSEAECEGDARTPKLELRCSGERCPPNRDVPLENGQARFASLPSATYELRLGDLWRESLRVEPGTHHIALDVPMFSLAGTITRDGAPVRARVIAGGGSSIGDGSYTLRFPKESYRAVIRECDADGEFVHLSNVPLSTLTKLDLELPSPIAIRVVDAATAKPVARARVHALVLDPQNPRGERFTEHLPPADDKGEVTLRRIPLTKFSICARAEDYAERCVASDASDRFVIALTRVETAAGAIENVSGVRGGALFFVTPDGAEVEVVGVASDGTFKHRHPHGPNERAVFMSLSHPLAVLPLPATGPLRLHIPTAPVRDLVVRTAKDAEYELGLSIGGTIVPAGALQRHQTLRGRMPFTTNGEAVLVSLVESAPIVVYRGFSRLARPPHLPPGADPFAMPELRAQFPFAVAGDGPVVLP